MRLLTITALTLSTAIGFSVPAFAETNPGVAQLEVEAGVPAGSLSTNDLYRLIRAMRDDDTQTVNFIKARAGLVQDGSVDGAVVIIPVDGDEQLARDAGVENGVYTTNELRRLILAKRDNDQNIIDFIMAGGDRAMSEARGEVTPGEEQIATELGVDPKLYTLQELTEMKARWEAGKDK